MSGEKVPLELIEGVRSKITDTVIIGYGSTEAGAETNFTEPGEDSAKIADGYVGKPLPTVEIKIVDEKSGVTDVRAATLVDFIYAILLYYKLFESTLPMSTTWLFIGLLGGRELAISLNRNKPKKLKRATSRALKMIGKDMLYALIGLLISLILALAINDGIRKEIFDMIF